MQKRVWTCRCMFWYLQATIVNNVIKHVFTGKNQICKYRFGHVFACFRYVHDNTCLFVHVPDVQIQARNLYLQVWYLQAKRNRTMFQNCFCIQVWNMQVPEIFDFWVDPVFASTNMFLNLGTNHSRTCPDLYVQNSSLKAFFLVFDTFQHVFSGTCKTCKNRFLQKPV